MTITRFAIIRTFSFKRAALWAQIGLCLILASLAYTYAIVCFAAMAASETITNPLVVQTVVAMLLVVALFGWALRACFALENLR